MSATATIADWGVGSETGRLTDVLLCRPTHYRWLPTNVIAERTLGGGGQADPAGIARQFREFEDAFDQAGVQRHYLAPEPQLPYQVYTRDSSQMTPWGAVVTQLFRPQRRGEYVAILDFYAAAGIPIWRKSSAGTLEGGDIHVIRPGLAVVGYSGGRTDLDGARQFQRWFEAEGWEVRLQPFDEHFLHLDVLFCMVSDRLAVACTDVLDADFTGWLADRQIRCVPVPYRDAMRLGCNLLALGEDRVLSPAASRDLNARLRAEGLAVLDPDLDLFTAGGGGAHCMTMPLKRI